ncbi:uncharacterized protein LOC111326349 [Stylophora pistillata]|uniref:uncharacterized protein LOC111326349 n=1 Tax=Stylophora pistillata TaxID=50429 RepID=UPI000C04C131|nr:uncharacterized protein LOC111326349 [Stylophora pistillata]
MSSRLVKVFFRGGKDNSWKWVDWTKKLRVPPKLENGIVTFEVDGTATCQINRFLECVVILDSSKTPLDAEELFIVDSACPQHLGFFAFWRQKEEQPTQDPELGSLFLGCFPLHMKTELAKEISSEHGVLFYGEAKSARQLADGDQALFSLSRSLTPVDEGIDIDYTPVKFSVRFEAPTIEFFKRENHKEGREKLCSLFLHPVAPFENRSPAISGEISQSQEQPPVCEPSTSVESPVKDLAQIEELRKSVVTLKIATLCNKHIGSCWKKVGIFLGVDEAEICNIESDYGKVRDKGGAVLQSWRDKNGSNATVGRLESTLIAIGMKRIAEKLLDIAREEIGRESEQNGDGSVEQQDTCSSPVEGDKEGETGQRPTREREVSPETMPGTSGEVDAPRTRDIEQSERSDKTASSQRKLNELRQSIEKVREMNQAVTRIKARVDELPSRQLNTGRNEPFDTTNSLLREVAALQEAIVRRARNENLEGLRELMEKVRKAREDLSGAS